MVLILTVDCTPFDDRAVVHPFNSVILSDIIAPVEHFTMNSHSQGHFHRSPTIFAGFSFLYRISIAFGVL